MTCFTRCLRISITAFATSLAALSSTLAAYKIAPGDVLSLVVNGAPELTARTAVDDDGQAVLPLIGAMHVGGLTLAEATVAVQSTLPAKEIDQRLADGRLIPIIISPFQINLTIAEYRPVYLSGDVAKPGAVPYRPGLTVRQAVALAGGLDLVRIRFANPFMQITQLKGQAEEYLVEYLKAQALVARLKAESTNQNAISSASLDDIPLPRALVEEVLVNERNELAARDNDWSKQRDYLKEAVKQVGERSGLLELQKEKEAEGLDSDLADLQRYQELFKKGAVALPSIAEARRNVLLSSTRTLQTESALSLSERDRSELEQRLARLDSERQGSVLKELQEATLSVATAKAKLRAVNTQLGFAGALKSQVVQGFGNGVTIDIHRDISDHPSLVSSSPDARLQPGDVVEISLPATPSMFPVP